MQFTPQQKCSRKWYLIQTCDFSLPIAGIPTQIRLAGGEKEWIGRVELQINGIWGQVCGGSQWRASESKVACRQRGYTGVLGELTMSAPAVLVMWKPHKESLHNDLAICSHSYMDASWWSCGIVWSCIYLPHRHASQHQLQIGRWPILVTGTEVQWLWEQPAGLQLHKHHRDRLWLWWSSGRHVWPWVVH